MIFLVTHADRNGTGKAQRVDARTPQAAARKVFGKNTSFGAERVTMAGAIRALVFSTMYGNGEVQWANQPNIALVTYPNVVDAEPFWTDPNEWKDTAHPIAVLA